MATAAVKKRKRILLTIEDKLEMCRLVKQGETLANVANNSYPCILVDKSKKHSFVQFIIIRPPDNYPFLYGITILNFCQAGLQFVLIFYCIMVCRLSNCS